MKRFILTLLNVACFSFASAQSWQDPAVNEENRLPAHADFTNRNEETTPHPRIFLRSCYFYIERKEISNQIILAW